MNTPGRPPADTVQSIGERAVIERIRRRFPSDPAILPVGIGDDAAVVEPVRGALEILTTDALVEGVHFDTAFSSYSDIGYKALAVNVSDVAAMGGTPRVALLSLALPGQLPVADLDALLAGFEEMAREARVTLAGGNITSSPGPLVVDVFLTGSARPRKVLTRAGARAGDALYVTGDIGAAAAGLQWLRARSADAGEPSDPELAACVARYRRPAPRLRLGSIAGRTRAASACMDLSDGLADAVRQMAGASGLGAALEAASLPVAPGARAWFATRREDPELAALAGGDDYELLLAVPARRMGRLRHALQQAGPLRATRIGKLTDEPSLVLMREGSAIPLPGGFTHF